MLCDMQAHIDNMTAAQKRAVRVFLNVFVVAAVAAGLWLAGGVHEVHPVQTHTDPSEILTDVPGPRI